MVEVTSNMRIGGFHEETALSFIKKHHKAGPVQLSSALLIAAVARNPGYFQTWPDCALNFKIDLEAWVRQVYYGLESSEA